MPYHCDLFVKIFSAMNFMARNVNKSSSQQIRNCYRNVMTLLQFCNECLICKPVAVLCLQSTNRCWCNTECTPEYHIWSFAQTKCFRDSQMMNILTEQPFAAKGDYFPPAPLFWCVPTDLKLYSRKYFIYYLEGHPTCYVLSQLT